MWHPAPPPTPRPAAPCPARSLLSARNLDAYHEVLYKRLDKLLNTTQPRKSVMLAIDGPAPLAKLMTQRERRKVGAGRGAGGHWEAGSACSTSCDCGLWVVGGRVKGVCFQLCRIYGVGCNNG